MEITPTAHTTEAYCGHVKKQQGTCNMSPHGSCGGIQVSLRLG